MKIDRELIRQQAKLELARREFFYFCHLLAPDFYKPEREYLRTLCDEMQDFYEGDDDILIINLPPRHGKSRTAGLLAQWVFGRNQSEKIMTGSYNETLSTTFSKAVRNGIQEVKADPDRVVYSDIFPGVRIKKGDGAMNLWSLEEGYNNYLATSPTGTATGFGCTCFPAGTLIYTDHGTMGIEEIYKQQQNGIRALSLSHSCDIIRMNKIEAIHRRYSNAIITIRTDAGREVRCTKDHRFYVEGKGYVQAEDLKKGDQVKTAEIQRTMPTVQKAKSRQRKAVLGVLQSKQDNKNNSTMRLLQEGISGSEIRVRKSTQEGVQKKLLLRHMFLQGKRRKTKNQKMSDMRKVPRKNKEVLFGRVQKNRDGKKQGAQKYNLPCMSKGVSTHYKPDKILFYGLQEQGTFTANDGGWKLPLQRRDKLQQGVYRYKTGDQKKRRVSLPDVWGERKSLHVHKGRGKYRKIKLGCASYRRRYTKQRSGKPSNTVYELPYRLTQNEKIIFVGHEYQKGYVYDLQVANDHNFFANGFLVHNCMIIDDLIKNVEEAYSENTLEKHWLWFTDTMLSRLEEGGKIIIIMTRWATGDLAGRALEHFAEEKKKVRLLTMKAVQDDGTMLCPEILSRESYEMKVRAMNADIASANYQQIPIDIRGKLYSSFKTYADIPRDSSGNPLFTGIYSYCDSADQGDDYLCNIIWGDYQKEAYILDVIYTKEPMELTEPAVAQALFKFKVNRARFESNAGGRSFARNVRRILEDELRSNHTNISWFHQSKNKVARIISNATWVMSHIYYPVNWRDRWPEYHKAMTTYQREGKNQHDDGPDATTGLAETMYLLGA
jgi:predicted phage terminase large subunit-like protein